jgi:hypothetical protein
MSGLPRVILDTSVINALEDGGQQYEPLMRGLVCGYEIILPATSADEIVSTKKVRRREALLSRFVRLLTVAKCIMPPHEIVRALITEHVSNPLFDWTDVDVRAPEYEVAIPARDFDESICAENRIQQFESQTYWEKTWKKSRPDFDKVFDAVLRASLRVITIMLSSSLRRMAFSGASGSGCIERCRGNNSQTWRLGPLLRYAHLSALCYGLVMAAYNGSIRPLDGGPKAPGRIDLLMAAYLPYCSRFVTADWPQRRDLAEVAAQARIGCTVLAFEEFDRSFSATV